MASKFIDPVPPLKSQLWGCDRLSLGLLLFFFPFLLDDCVPYILQVICNIVACNMVQYSLENLKCYVCDLPVTATKRASLNSHLRLAPVGSRAIWWCAVGPGQKFINNRLKRLARCFLNLISSDWSFSIPSTSFATISKIVLCWSHLMTNPGVTCKTSTHVRSPL